MKTNKSKSKKSEIIDGFTIKYHANGQTIWSKGKIIDDNQKAIGNGIALMAQLNAQDISTKESQ